MPLASVPLSAQDVPESCGVRDWFQLRDIVAQGGSSLLCKGAMDAAFEHRREAERELNQVVREAPGSDDARAALDLLIAFYSRHGEYRKALSQQVLVVVARYIPESCGVRDWFQLRAKVAQGGSSLLCKGAMDEIFEHRREAERELNQVVREAPRSDDALPAHWLLAMLYSRHGQYRKALSQVDQANEAEDPEERQRLRPVDDMLSMFAALAQFPDLRITHRARSVVQGELNNDGHFYIPLTIHGVSANYILDTGATNGVVTASEAKRLGLVFHESSTKLSDVNEDPTSANGLAEAPDLWIGRIHLKNVAFWVYPDGNDILSGLPNGQKGVLGLPVLLALAALRVEKDHRIVVGPRESTPSDQSIPLAFDYQWTLVQIVVHERPLTLQLDTGADKTYLYQTFADAFPSLMQLGQHRKEKIPEISGTSYQEAIEVPRVGFRLTPRVEMDLAPATVILNATGEYSWDGNFGFDLFDKALPVTIDFRAMRLSFP
jgi:tetratricopeptide (TPR) repeat protein